MTTQPQILQAPKPETGNVIIEALEQALADTINTAVPVLTQTGMALLLGALSNLINHHANVAKTAALAPKPPNPNPAPIVLPNPAPIVP